MNKRIQIIEVQNIAISISKVKDDDFICLTDMAKGKESDAGVADREEKVNEYRIDVV